MFSPSRISLAGSERGILIGIGLYGSLHFIHYSICRRAFQEKKRIKVAKTLEIYEKQKLAAHVKEVGDYLEEQLKKLVEDYDCVVEQRGLGLIRGIKLSGPVGEVVKKAMEEGLLIISARSDVIRLVPPLVIEKEHVDEMIEKLRKVL